MKRFWKRFNLAGFLMFALCVVLGVGDLSGAVLSADGVATDVVDPSKAATSSPKNEGGTQLRSGERSALASWDYRRWSPDLIKDPVMREVIQWRTDATPLDTILNYIGSDHINNIPFKYWVIADSALDCPILLFEQGTAVADKSRTRGYLYVSDTYAGIISQNDNLLVEDIVSGEAQEGNGLYLFVQKVEHGVEKTIDGESVTTTKLTVTIDGEQATGSDNYQIPAISSTARVYVCGNAHNELDVTSPDLEFLPTEKEGYCQIFKAEITLSNYAAMADKEFKWDLPEIEREVVYRWKRAKEKAYLFGRKSKVYDINGKEVYRTGGLFTEVLKNQGGIPIVVDSTKSNAEGEFVDMMRNVFVGNGGSKERFVMAGSSAIAKLTKMMLKGVQKHQDAMKTEYVEGLTWSKITSPFGTLNLISHTLFDETPYKDYALVFDPQFVKKKEVLAMNRQEVNGQEHLIVNGKIVILTETAGVAVLNPNAHKVLRIS